VEIENNTSGSILQHTLSWDLKQSILRNQENLDSN